MQSTVTLSGNVVTDVTLRSTTGGSVANFRMAVSNGYFDKRTQQYVERTTFLNVSAWRQLGENVAASLVKGHPVVVVGRLRQREFEREGQRITVVEVDADAVGHDLSRGEGTFRRNTRGPQTSDLAQVAWAMPGAGTPDLDGSNPDHAHAGVGSPLAAESAA
ncbi:unannotated protein [freshwater metagenome]|uniref:Unannotated protein n=1 Tax=freshwater metagenome TaxID=449393 RepID=A0A6J7R074_9ZZZZ